MKWLDLRTPRLRFLEYGGFDDKFPKHEGLPVLETLKIDLRGFSLSDCKAKEDQEKRLNDEVMSLFSTIPNIKSLTIFSNAFILLSLFPDELVMRRGSPFRELKDLTLHISGYCVPRKCESVRAYLLHNSPDAKFNTIMHHLS